jgi:hypothetical protein
MKGFPWLTYMVNWGFDYVTLVINSDVHSNDQWISFKSLCLAHPLGMHLKRILHTISPFLKGIVWVQ